EHGEINSLIFNGLTAHDENNKVVPCLAQDWKFDEATNTYTFNFFNFMMLPLLLFIKYFSKLCPPLFK
ncbi:hypothetical protein, partial [Clostridioides difficile]|uniref:hypothetical protein n=1 Tax=Clostridioides difficile TaxID=1496 RepID=UPI001144BB7F